MRLRLAFVIGAFLMLLPLDMSAQEVMVKSLTKTTGFIPGNEQRRDANGDLCALLKIQVVDGVTRIEGTPPIGNLVDRGTEKWVFLPKGTRQVTIHFEKHLPLSVYFREHNSEIVALESNRVYQLVLIDKERPKPAESKVRFGLRGGLNYSFPDMEQHTGDHYGNVASFHIGPTIDCRLQKHFALQGALLLSGKGFTNDNHLDDYDMHASAYYLDIPIEAAYIPVSTKSLQLRLFAGPYAAICISGTIEDQRYNAFNYSFSDKYGGFDFGLSAGAAMVAGGHFILSANYQHGFGTDYKNRCMALSVGYIF